MSSTIQRIFIDEKLEPGLILKLSKEDSNYLANVLRLENGAKLKIFNEKYGEFLAEIVSSYHKACEIKILEKLKDTEKLLSIILGFAPIKHYRLCFLIEKATELGVTEFQPVITERTINRNVKIDKLFLTGKEASEQSGRIVTPKFHEQIKIEKFITSYKNHTILAAIESVDAKPFDFELDNDKVVLLVGPEGGFSEREKQLLLSQSNVKPVNLGPRILRAETAVCCLLSSINCKL
ncbi:MAG: 16S rRNA (uracil(1498)-N(3))-methyltransferase [Sphingobacteriia bacterium]|nr:16S rRNA (uracil(1498)-N(3))-methyltransferase [Sphingobacteriia bacterium]